MSTKSDKRGHISIMDYDIYGTLRSLWNSNTTNDTKYTQINTNKSTHSEMDPVCLLEEKGYIK